MAKILCSYSGIEFQCEHFPCFLEAGEYAHPIFALPLKKLWKFIPKWQAGELTQTDSYLLFLSVLKNSDLVQWRCPVSRTVTTNSIVSHNMERLFDVVTKVSEIRHPRFVIPQFVISSETRTLSNVRYWIDTWEERYSDFCSGLRDQELRSKVQKKEIALEKLIKNPSIKPEKYAHILASWAADAGMFPEFLSDTPFGTIPLSTYWKEIISRSYNQVEMLSIPSADLQELITHCEENIDMGTIFSYHLMACLRDALSTIQGFFSIGATTFTLLDSVEQDAVEAANLANVIKSAPSQEPKRIDYPSDFAFTKAKLKWQVACSQMQKGGN